MDRIFPFKRPDRGFSLVEMLAVVVIIGILAGFIAAAAQAAKRRALITRMRIELDGLAQAMETYRTEVGSGAYPPSDPGLAAQHLRRAFPRYAGGMSATFSGPAEAIHFWLAGPTGDGWSANPTNPFMAAGSRVGPFFEFDPDKIRGNHEYLPFVGSTDGYVYIRADSYSSGSAITRDGTEYANPYSFQIHGPGLDGKLGSGGHLNSSDGYDDDRWDDINNCCEGTLGDRNK